MTSLIIIKYSTWHAHKKNNFAIFSSRQLSYYYTYLEDIFIKINALLLKFSILVAVFVNIGFLLTMLAAFKRKLLLPEGAASFF